MTTTLQTFIQLLKRDYYVTASRFKDQLLNEIVIEPFFFIINFGYILPSIIWPNATPQQATMILASGMVLSGMSTAFNLLMDTLTDLETNRLVDFERSILPDRLIVLRIITFSSICGFFFLLPYFPIAKLLLGSNFTLAGLSIPKTLCAIFLSILMLVTLNLACMLYIRGSDGITNLWIRFYHPLLMLGGFLVPLHVIKKLSPLLGKVLMLNPLIYITETVGNAVVGTDVYMPFWQSATGLLAYTGLFTCLALLFFKRKVDHI